MWKKYTTEEIVEKIKELHGNRYEFPNFKYNNDRDTIITIVCPKHGEFQSSVHYILKATKGFICKKCRNENQHRILFQKKHGNISLQDFLIKILGTKKYCLNVDINKISKDIYFTISTSGKKKNRVELFCKKHGRFIINVASLINYEDSGCPDCKKEDGLWGKKTYDAHTFLPYEEARKYIWQFKLKSKEEYWKWWDKNKPNFLPKHPHRYYDKY